MKKFYLSCLLFSGLALLGNFAYAQTWVQKMQDPSVNFYDLRQEFEKHWKERPMEKGKGWKQFRRYEYFMEPRVYPSGDRSQPARAYEEFQRYLKDHPEINQANANARMGSVANWTYIGNTTIPTNGGGAGRINFIRFMPGNNSIIFVGAPAGGLWKTTNGGTSWTTSTDAMTVLGFSDMAINPTTTSTMYLATGDGESSDTYSIGVLKSTDGGVTWNTTGLSWTVSQKRLISKLLIHPTNPSILLAATSAGIWRTTDAGATWTQSSTVSGFKDMEFKPGDPNTVYASGSNFYKSTDGGVTFAQVTTGIPTGNNRIAIGVTAANSGYVYLLTGKSSDSGFNGLYRSTDSGTTFSTRSTTPNILGWQSNGSDAGGQSWYDLAIAVSPTNAEEVICGGVNVWRSTNGGTTWTINGHWTGSGAPYVHADIHALEFLPGSSTTYFAGCDGGVFKTTASGSSWTDISANMQIAQIYRLGLSASDASLAITGWQDNGTNRRNSTGWRRVIGGDGMECFIDRSNNNYQYGELYYGDFRRSADGGTSWTSIKPAAAGNGDWVTPWQMSPSSTTTLFAGFAQIWKSTDRGTSWAQLGTVTGTGNFKSLAVAPSNANVIYAARTTSIVKTTDGGANWTTITTGLPTGSAQITYIAVSPTDPNKLWVTFSGYSAVNKVFMSANGGTTWTNWSDGLPNLPVNCAVYQNATNDRIYVGTDVGVYFRDRYHTAWQPFLTGLPNVVVNELEIYYGTSKLRAATYGRGLWETDLYTPPVGTPVPAFTSNRTKVMATGSVNFTDQTTGSAGSYSWSFPGGAPATSTAQSPTGIVYSTPGTYDVTLTVTDASGISYAEIKKAYITVVPYCVGTFTAVASATSTTLCEGSSTSLKVMVTNEPPTGYCSSNATSTLYSDIGNVTFAGINNGTASPATSNPDANGTYTDFTGTVPPAQVNQGSGYAISIDRITSRTSLYSAYLKVFIDYNFDGDFDDAGELALEGSSTATVPLVTGTITVPATAMRGTTRMRVVLRESGSTTTTVACGTYTYGETEDYLVTISGNNNNGPFTYSWSPTTGLSNPNIANPTVTPAGTTTYTVTVTGEVPECTTTSQATIVVNPVPVVSATAADPSVCAGSSTQLTAKPLNPLWLKITEVVLYRTGTGYTNPYPSYATGADMIEISNLSASAMDISGYTVEAWLGTSTSPNRSYTFANGVTIPANSVLLLAFASGTDDPLYRYYNTGGSNDGFSSVSSVGFVIKNGTTVVDAVAANGHNFVTASGVTALHWSGTVGSSSGKAGLIRTGATDTNSPDNWTVASATNVQTIGTYNAGLNTVGLGTYSWSPGGMSGSTVSVTPSATTTYTAYYYPPVGCSRSGQATVTVIPASASSDAGITAMTKPGTAGCATNMPVEVTIKNFNTTTAIACVPVEVVISGPLNKTLTGFYTSSIAANGTATLLVGEVDMSASGTYSFNARTLVSGDVNSANDALATQTRTVASPAALPLATVDFTSFTGSNLATVHPGWYETNGWPNPTGTTSNWTYCNTTQETAFGTRTARINLYSTAKKHWIAGPRFTATSGSQVSFNVAVTNWNYATTDAMGSDDAVSLMISTDCGYSFTSLRTFTSADNLSNTLTNFVVSLSAYAGQDVVIGFYATDGTVDDLEDYDFHVDNIMVGEQGMLVAGINADLNNTTLGVYAWPNPFGKEVNLQVNTTISGEATIRVIDVLGREVYVKRHSVEAGEQTLSLPVAGALKPGVYMVLVQQEQEVRQVRIVKE